MYFGILYELQVTQKYWFYNDYLLKFSVKKFVRIKFTFSIAQFIIRKNLC